MTPHGVKSAAAPRQRTDEAGEDSEYSDRCPFCAIACSFPPVNPLDDPQAIEQQQHPEKTSPPSQVIYSGEHVLAFLDIQPLTWGHTLVIPRKHKMKMGDLHAADGAELGRHLPLIARAVMRAVFDIPYDPVSLENQDADYNIVQNNGPLAAQVVPHVHHHIIPRLPDTHTHFQKATHPPPARVSQTSSHYQASWTMFGRGYRTDLDENDPETLQLVQRMRLEIAREFSRGEKEEKSRL